MEAVACREETVREAGEAVNLVEDYRRIEAALTFLEERFREQPSLEEAARHVHLSPFHFERLFKRWAGVTPKQFQQYLTLEHVKEVMTESRSVLDAAYAAGLSGAGRLHDLFVSIDAVTPGQYLARGEGLTISYGVHPSPFGLCFAAVTDRGLCRLTFVAPGAEQAEADALRAAWPAAELREDQAAARLLIQEIMAPDAEIRSRPFHLLLKGTNFQVKVWEALLSIPPGRVVSYEDVAAHIGRPASVRAVASAIGQNPIGYLIPCHRVLRKSGALGGYRWGEPRKRLLLGWEAARASGPTTAR